MEPHLELIYDNLRRQLDPDLLNIDTHLMQLPQFQMEASEHAADAARAASEEEFVLKAVTAEVARRLRNTGDKKPAESQILMDVLLDPEVQNQQSILQQATQDKEKWRALVDALRTKGSVMKTSAELIIAGYLTPRAAGENSRAALARARQERDKS